MARALQLATGLLLVVVGALLGLYGLLSLLWREDGAGRTYVTLFGHQRDAHLVGAVSLLIAAALISSAVLLLHLRRRG